LTPQGEIIVQNVLAISKVKYLAEINIQKYVTTQKYYYLPGKK